MDFFSVDLLFVINVGWECIWKMCEYFFILV